MADTPGWFVPLSRRSFLQYTALSSGLLTLSRLHALPALAEPNGAAGLQVLNSQEAQILTVIVERIVFTGDPRMPAVRDTRAIETIDRALLQLDATVQSQMRWLLRVFEWGPPVFQLKFKAFTGMNDEERDAYLRDWAASGLAMRKLAFRALKNLSMLGYYSQDATWKAIHYDGPWVPRPRRTITSDQLPIASI
jgi:hypothetical protein